MPNYTSSRYLKQKGLVLLCALALLIPLIPAKPQPGAPADNPAVTRANYDLAAKWTAAKVGKLVFDTAVTPHWLETGDRFWYTYQTSQGRNFYLVDSVKKSKTLLFDKAKMAAMLTAITRIPYDSQHLPFPQTPTQTLKFVKKDTAFQFQFDVPIDADIVMTKKVDQAAQKTDQTAQTGQTGQRGQTQGQRGGRGGAPAAPSRTKTLHFEYDLTTGKVTLLEDWKDPDRKPAWANVSPDGKTIVFARNHNLYMMDADNYEKAKKPDSENDKSIVETQIATDGVEHYSFAGRAGRGGGDQQQQQEEVTTQEQGEGRGNVRMPPVSLTWSKDSKRFSVVRRDEKKVADLWVINTLANPRPTLLTYRYAMPGEANIPQTEILAFDRDTKARMKLKADIWKDQSMNVLPARVTALFREQNPDRTEDTWFTDATDKIYVTRRSRDYHKLDMCVVNPDTGEAKVLLEERLNTYIETQGPRLINNGQEFIWWSERDGWGHLYRYGIDGTLKNQITSGEFVCVAAGGGGGGGRGGGGAVQGVDEKTGTIFFTAVGREPGEDPYYPHLYRINLDGTGLKLLDPGDASHSVNMCESTRYFVDNSSRINTAPKSVLYDNAGNLVMDLETTDVKPLLEAGFKFPEPFKVKADDGITDIYGVMYRPFDFDPIKKYPIILYVYPGPQTESVTKTFSPRGYSSFLAQFGFIVVEVGNRGGNPQRSKWYHNYSYGPGAQDISFRDYGLADKKAAVEQLAHRFAYIDINKVGIWGHSGGGFMSAAAMLVYPDFFKVAWSESGNHENNVYNNTWSEQNHGIKEVTDKDGNVTFEYTMDKNSEVAKNLKGHLMLTTGDYDNNVHPANTMRLADALIKANKRFDMMIFPGQPHSYGPDGDYCSWIRADYFCKWLLGDFASSVDLVELAREKAQDNKPETTGGRGGGRGRGGN
jgi:dipeptidyl aminopeptidase/acylaminoacyl peptidase